MMNTAKTDKVSSTTWKLRQNCEWPKWWEWKFNTWQFDIPKITEDINRYFVFHYSLSVRLITVHSLMFSYLRTICHNIRIMNDQLSSDFEL